METNVYDGRGSAQEAHGRPAVRIVVFAALYALAILAGRATRIPPSELALAWPAAGVAIAWLLLARGRSETWMASASIVVVTAVMNQTSGLEATASWLFGFVNLSHGLVGAGLLRLLNPGGASRLPRTLRDIAALGGAAFGAAATSAVMGGLVAWVRLDRGLLDGVGMIGVRNALSSFVVLNAILAATQLRTARRGSPVGCAVIAVGALALSAALLVTPWPLAFVVVPVVLGVVLRCGLAVTAVLVAVLGVLVVQLTVRGRGQFAAIDDVEPRVLVAQAFILVLALVGLVMAVLEEERDAALEASSRDRDLLKNHMEAALVASAHLVLEVDGTCRCEEVNHALVALVGGRRVDLVGSDPRRWLVPDDADRLEEALADLQEHRATGWRGQLQVVEALGGAWVDVAVAVVQADDAPVQGARQPTAMTLQMVDLTAQKRAERALAHAALHDDLTGLANRSLWMDRLEEALREAAVEGLSVVVMYIDVDHFKTVNDSYGHGAGDEVLRDVAERLASVVGERGTVARMGGDEFVLLSRPGLVEAADPLAQGIKEAMQAPTRLHDGRLVRFTVSIGIAETKGQAVDARLVLRQADVALYTAKERGRGRYEFFAPSMHGSLEASARLLLDLERGHAADELGLVYQPIVDVESGAPVAVEALLRWEHPHRGVLSPRDFLDVLEVTELMHAVGDDVLRTACRAGDSLSVRGMPVAVHVNVSANELARPQLAERVQAALAQSSLDAGNLVLEVTETRIVEVTGSLLDDLFALRDLGVRIAVDDFGTGFSTLTHLVDLPVDIVKLDSSFVAGVLEPGPARSVCAGVIAMADGLGVDAVAEGVETVEQAEALRSMGYRLMQGYRWGRPVGVEQLVARWPAARA